ncbi:MAG: hypothetical protein AAF597_19070, partial [Bacteroidota bacterium]
NARQVTRFGFFRDGNYLDIGSAFSGLQGTYDAPEAQVTIQNDRSTPRLRQFIGNLWSDPNTIVQPAFPNGGYVLSSAESATNDAVELELTILRGVSGFRDGITPFFDAIGGALLPGDSIIVEYQVPMIQNPVDQTLNQDRLLGALDFGLRSVAGASRYSDGEAGTGNTINTPIGNCTTVPAFGNFTNPAVVGSAEVTYTDCQAELVAKFAVAGIPAGWFADEYRLIAGLEQVSFDLPYPFYYCGGATWETTQLPATEIEPDSTNITPVTVGGQLAYLPPGNLTFTDAEFLNGVRPIGYRDYFQGDNDTRTIGGTFPLIGYDGATNTSDTITFRIPLKRACGETPPADFEISYNSANKYLPDLLMPDYSSDFLVVGDPSAGRLMSFE